MKCFRAQFLPAGAGDSLLARDRSKYTVCGYWTGIKGCGFLFHVIFFSRKLVLSSNAKSGAHFSLSLLSWQILSPHCAVLPKVGGAVFRQCGTVLPPLSNMPLLVFMVKPGSMVSHLISLVLVKVLSYMNYYSIWCSCWGTLVRRFYYVILLYLFLFSWFLFCIVYCFCIEMLPIFVILYPTALVYLFISLAVFWRSLRIF